MNIVDECVSVVPDFSGLSVGEVEAEFFTLSGHLAAGECRQLLLLAELAERGSWLADGYRSLPQWLSARAGIDPGTAAARLRVAVRLRRLPLVTAAFASGRLSYSQVRAISRALCSGADPALEADMVELAGSLTAAQLETACQVMAGLSDDQAADAEARTSLRCRDIGPGLSEIRVLLPTVERERVMAAVDRRVQAEPAPPDEGVPLEPLDRRRALALVDLAVAVAGEPADRPAVNIVVSLADYEARRAGGLGDRPVAAGVIDWCLCEGDTRTVVVNEHGQPVMAASKRRFGTTRQRRAATTRDGGRCRCCGSRWRTQLHHTDHWEQSKKTVVDRLVTLCRACHAAHHTGAFTIDTDHTGEFVFTAPTGEPFHRPQRRIRGSHRGLVDANTAAGVTTVAAASHSRWDGEPLDTYWLPGRHTPDRAVPRDATGWSGINPGDVDDNDIHYDTPSPDDDTETEIEDVPRDASIEDVPPDASPGDVPRDAPRAAPPGPFHTAELLIALRDHARHELGWTDQDLTIYTNAIAALPDSPDHHVPRDASADAAAPTACPIRHAS